MKTDTSLQIPGDNEKQTNKQKTLLHLVSLSHVQRVLPLTSILPMHG